MLKILLPTNHTNSYQSKNAFARSAFGVRGVLGPASLVTALDRKATRGRVALQKLREMGQKFFSIRVHLRVSWVKSFLQK
jgi:hypothetical protein